MNKIFKMDLHRVSHSITFYVAIIFVAVMAFAQVKSGMSNTLDSLLGAGGNDDFMAAAMGSGVISILVSILISLFVCGDYSGGFAKNIFTVHANPWEYIGGKMLSMEVVSAFLLFLYTLLSIVALNIFGVGVTLNGGVIGLVVFLLEKLLLAAALNGAVLLIVLFTRNIAWGIFAGFLIATGGLAMGIALLAEFLGWGWLVNIFSVTISGASALCTLTFSPATLLRVLLAGVAWIAVSCIASHRVLKCKDI